MQLPSMTDTPHFWKHMVNVIVVLTAHRPSLMTAFLLWVSLWLVFEDVHVFGFSIGKIASLYMKAFEILPRQFCHSGVDLFCVCLFVFFLHQHIRQFMVLYRALSPPQPVFPKLHYLEDHVVPFIRKWRAGPGLLGEKVYMRNLTIWTDAMLQSLMQFSACSKCWNCIVFEQVLSRRMHQSLHHAGNLNLILFS